MDGKEDVGSTEFIDDNTFLFLWRVTLFVLDNCCQTYGAQRTQFARASPPCYIDNMSVDYLECEMSETVLSMLGATTILALYVTGILLTRECVMSELLTDYGMETVVALLERYGENPMICGLFYYMMGHALTQCRSGREG